MQYDQKKSFGYPILLSSGDDQSDYPNKGFKPDITLSISESNELDGEPVYKIEYEFPKIEDFSDLIDERKAGYFIKITSPNTFYSEMHAIEDYEGAFEISNCNLEGKIELWAVLVAKTKLELSSENFHDDFGDNVFEVEAGAVLAHDVPNRYYVHLDFLRTLESILVYRSSDKYKPGQIEVVLIKEKIEVLGHSDQISKLKQLSAKASIGGSDDASGVLMLNGVFVPIFMEVIEAMKTDRVDEELHWYNVIETKLNDLGIDNFKDGPDSTLKIVHKLFGLPLQLLDRAVR